MATLAQRSARRSGAVVAALAAVAIAGARVQLELGGGVGACPFRAVTGLPCPLCGSTRALALLSEGDAGFLHYNAVVALAVAVALTAGVVAAVRPDWAARLARLAPARHPLRTTVVVVLAAWVVAVANRGSIGSGPAP